MAKKPKVKRRSIKIRFDFPEDMPDSGVAIFGDFSGRDGEMMEGIWMTCFLTEHGYEKAVREGWVATITEGFWCTNPIAWIETEEIEGE